MKWTESYNHQQIEDCKTDMHHLAIAHLMLLVEALALVEMKEIIAERCRQRRQSAIGATVACSDHAKNEAHEGEATHRLRYHRIYLVAQHASVGTHRQLQSSMRGIVYEGSTEREEKQIHHDKEETGGNDILLRIAQRLASQVLLHHILIKSRHRDCNKSPRDYLFPIEFWMVEIGFPNAGIAFGGTGAKQFGNTDIQVFQNDHHRGYGSEEQEGGLQCIGPHHGLQSATECVE